MPTDETVYRNGAATIAQISLAGLAFEKLLRPWKPYWELSLCGDPAGDYKNAMEWSRYALYNGGDSLAVERWIFKYLLPQVRKLIAEHWSDIAAVGELLALRGELSQAEVEVALANK